VVTTEEDFQKALDKNPDDWQTRLVFADWLQERGDVRAEGYRAIGAQRMRPNRWEQGKKKFHWWWGGGKSDWARHSDVVVLPKDGFEQLPAPRRDGHAWPAHDDPNTRRGAENAAALAFANLPAVRRAELLTAPPAVDL